MTAIAERAARLIATCGGIGLLKPGPGTWGSLAALLLGAGLNAIGGPACVAAGGLLALAAGAWAAQRYAAASGIADPGEVVIDEAAALLLVLACLPQGTAAWIAGFVLFRFFDIVKPWPISWCDRALKGALGIMADDLLAALFAGAGVWLLQALLLS